MRNRVCLFALASLDHVQMGIFNLVPPTSELRRAALPRLDRHSRSAPLRCAERWQGTLKAFSHSHSRKALSEAGQVEGFNKRLSCNCCACKVCERGAQ